jgi:glycine dehydrogenase subunit 2
VRAYSYILAMGGDGLREMSEVAVLNANYLRHQLQDVLHVSTEAPTLHEVVFSDKGLAEHGGITTLDLAKRLMDYGFHPPTIYFPLTVHGALMVEPTESEPRAELDRFVAAVRAILDEADRDPELVKTAPHLAPRRRLDETRAARQPVLRWTPPGSPLAK